MVARGAGAVGCAHCTLIGADRACQVCTRLVCEKCAASWTTCSEPSGRVVRLGASARLRDVDPAGRLGLVTHWRRPLRLFDLRQLRWISGVTVSRVAYLHNRGYPLRLTSDARVIYSEWTITLASSSGERLFDGIRVLDLRTDRSHLIKATEPPARRTAVTDTGDIFYYVTDTEHVAVVDGAASYTVDPLPRKVVQAVHLDGAQHVLAASTWSEVVLHRIVEQRSERVSRIVTERKGDIPWVAFGGDWLALAIRDGGRLHVEVRPLSRDLAIGEPAFHHETKRLDDASLSRDGRYLALAVDDGLLVQSLDTGDATVFTEHTDAINLVRFAGDDHVLISADTDNRVVLRPRTETGYARPLIAIDILDDGVAIG